MTVTSALCPLSLQTLFDQNALPIIPARLYFYLAQTQTPVIVYQDALLSVTHQQPVLTTGTGRVPPIYVGTDSYRVRIFDQHGALIEDIDGISGAVVPTSGGGGGGGTINPGDPRLLATGDMIAAFSQALRDGWVRCNGGTIGDSLSTASERANTDDCMPLFEWLWGQDTAHMLPIIGGRGASAHGDWLAHKQMTLPDYRARAIFGIDGMGGVATNRLNGAVLDDASTPAMLGGHGGRGTHIITAAEMPSHNHGATGITDSIGSHTHTATTDVQGDHAHTVPQGAGGAGIPPGSAVATAATQSAQATSVAGAHGHNITVFAAGVHQHNLSINVAATGGGGAHDSVNPFMTATIYMKL